VTNIISISLNDDILSELEKAQKSLGFSGKSELIRAGIRTFLSEEKQKIDLNGKKHAILLVIHYDKFDDLIAGIMHDFESLIITQLHSKIDGQRCMDLFVLDGDGKSIKSITQKFQTNKNMDTVKLFVI
jgi:CopG family nickel-responsive transcriptional regulator